MLKQPKLRQSFVGSVLRRALSDAEYTELCARYQGAKLGGRFLDLTKDHKAAGLEYLRGKITAVELIRALGLKPSVNEATNVTRADMWAGKAMRTVK